MSAITYVGSDLSCAANLFTSVTVCRRGAHMRTEAESIDSALAATASSGCPKRCDRGSEISGNWKEFGCFAGEHVASLSPVLWAGVVRSYHLRWCTPDERLEPVTLLDFPHSFQREEDAF